VEAREDPVTLRGNTIPLIDKAGEKCRELGRYEKGGGGTKGRGRSELFPRSVARLGASKWSTR